MGERCRVIDEKGPCKGDADRQVSGEDPGRPGATLSVHVCEIHAGKLDELGPFGTQYALRYFQEEPCGWRLMERTEPEA